MKKRNKLQILTIKLPLREQEMFELAKKGSQIALRKEVEDSLVKFLEYVENLNQMKEELLRMIEEYADKVMPNFTKIEGKKVVITRRAWGSKYAVENEEKAKPFVREFIIKRKTVDSKKVEEYLKETGELPEGIVEKARRVQLKVEIKKASAG